MTLKVHSRSRLTQEQVSYIFIVYLIVSHFIASFYCVFLSILSLSVCVYFMFYVLPVGLINDGDDVFKTYICGFIV